MSFFLPQKMQNDTTIKLLIYKQLLCEVLVSVTNLIKCLGHLWLPVLFFRTVALIMTHRTTDHSSNYRKSSLPCNVFYIFITVLVMVPPTPPMYFPTLDTIMLIGPPFTAEFCCSSLTQWIIS